MRARHLSRNLAGLAAAIGLLALIGCGVLASRRTEFANQAETSEGRPLFFEDIEDIVFNDLLTLDEKREGLAELGIEDEDLITALLTLAPPPPAGAAPLASSAVPDPATGECPPAGADQEFCWVLEGLCAYCPAGACASPGEQFCRG